MGKEKKMKKYFLENIKYDGFGESFEALTEPMSWEKALQEFDSLVEKANVGNIYANVSEGDRNDPRTHGQFLIDYVCNPTVYENGREEDYITISEIEE